MVLRAWAQDNLLHFSCRVAHSALYVALVYTTCFMRYNTSFMAFETKLWQFFSSMIQTRGKKWICWIEKRSCWTILILLIYMKRFRIETLKCVCRTGVVAETSYIKKHEWFAWGQLQDQCQNQPHQPSPMAPPRFWWRCCSAAVAVAAVERSQANNIHRRLFFFSVSFVFSPLSKSGLCDTLLQAAAPAHSSALKSAKVLTG